jgi:hypothetical protein
MRGVRVLWAGRDRSLLWHGTSGFLVSSEGPPHSVASYGCGGCILTLILTGIALTLMAGFIGKLDHVMTAEFVNLLPYRRNVTSKIAVIWNQNFENPTLFSSFGTKQYEINLKPQLDLIHRPTGRQSMCYTTELFSYNYKISQINTVSPHYSSIRFTGIFDKRQKFHCNKST